MEFLTEGFEDGNVFGVHLGAQLIFTDVLQMAETEIFAERTELHPRFKTEVVGYHNCSNHQIVHHNIEWNQTPFVVAQI